MDLSKYKNADLNILTEKQREVFKLALSGKKQMEIAKMINVSRQNVFASLRVSCQKLDNWEQNKARKPKENEIKKETHLCYRSAVKFPAVEKKELEILSDREKEIYKCRAYGKLTYQEIAEKMGTSASTVSVIWKNARDKLEGKETSAAKWNRINKEKINKYRRENEHIRKRRSDYAHKYHLENKEKLNNYNREYYLRNRDEILKKRRKNSLKNNDEIIERKRIKPKKIKKNGPFRQVHELYEDGYSINKISFLLGLSYNKVRKILITEGLYKDELSIKIAELVKQGKTTSQIAEIVGRTEKSINNYLPYTKGTYGWELTKNAKRIKKYRESKKNKSTENL